MGYSDHENFAGPIVDLRAHAPISYANSPNAFFAFNFHTSGWAGVRREPWDGSHDAVLHRPVKAFQLTLGSRCDADLKHRSRQPILTPLLRHRTTGAHHLCFRALRGPSVSPPSFPRNLRWEE